MPYPSLIKHGITKLHTLWFSLPDESILWYPYKIYGWYIYPFCLTITLFLLATRLLLPAIKPLLPATKLLLPAIKPLLPATKLLLPTIKPLLPAIKLLLPATKLLLPAIKLLSPATRVILPIITALFAYQLLPGTVVFGCCALKF